MPLTAENLLRELTAAGYRAVRGAPDPGTFDRNGNEYQLHRRAFAFPDGNEPARVLRVRLTAGQVQSLSDGAGKRVALARLDPALIGNIYPLSGEDREVVKLEQAPDLLIAGLLAVEDRRFTDHSGVDLRGLARAVWSNLRARQFVEGGSTITQQLAKNLFLSHDRSIRRKIDEAIMAGLLELHLRKDEILELYLNEVFLDQRGGQAVHGFGLAAEHFFGTPLENLDAAQVALLVGLVKGPSYYNPRRNPERARQRRNLVIDQMVAFDVLDERRAAAAREAPLGVIETPSRPGTRFGAFLDLARWHLRRDYREDDLRREGLRILTTLDPSAQAVAQEALRSKIASSLQGAVVIVDPHTGEVQAVVGGREENAGGFNRALLAKRQIGSIFKPLVYLTALNQPRSYTLATVLDDGPFALVSETGQEWAPRNFDGRYHGEVLLVDALSRSYNVATARLGHAVGMSNVFELARSFGVALEAPAVPSTALGAVDLSPLEVAQLYQPIASGGFPTPLSTLRAVLSPDGATLERYGPRLDRTDPRTTFLVAWALREVTREGTARGLSRYLRSDTPFAGKTGTSNDGRDAWFAGFGDDRLAVVWVGRDDNQPAGLTGAENAMPVFAELALGIQAQGLSLPAPEGVELREIDRTTGLRAGRRCSDTIILPFLAGTAPRRESACR